MDKPTVYLDTNVFSAYWYEGADVAAVARRFHTREWWDTERRHFSTFQMAVSTAYEVDYLLTWNYAHLANPIAQKRLETICRRLHLRAPLLVSPETIPQVRFGQTIRRRNR